jgi:PhzF family phenazine biosynthesis protein
MELNVDFVDAFTDTHFKGNPAAVIITDDWLSPALMQSIATENNLSETAFLVANLKPSPLKETLTRYFSIRWFSPLTEIEFCGHATLASAFVLFKQDTNLQSIVFMAAAVGELVVDKTPAGLIQMDFPNTKPKLVAAIPDELIKGLSIAPTEVYKNQQAYFVVYASESNVKTVLRDNASLKKLAPLDVVVTAKSESTDYDFISRYFWPANGGDEDPVTGSIHTGLAPLWFDKLGVKKLELDKLDIDKLKAEPSTLDQAQGNVATKLPKNTLMAYQASARGGVVHCSLKNDRVIIAGRAVQYLKGKITL